MIQSGEVDRAKHHAPRQGGHGGGKQAGDLAKAQATAQRYDRTLRSPWNCPMRPAATGKYRLLPSYFSLTWSRRKQDQRVETATAFPAVPNMTSALIAPVLRPFGSDQFISALNAFHPEAGTTIGNSHPHGSLHAFAFT